MLEVWAVKRKAAGKNSYLWVGATIGAPVEDRVADITLAFVSEGKVVES